MHEFAITSAILDIVLEKGREIRAAKINSIELRVGRLTGYIPESIQLQFAILSRGTAADGAILSFQQPAADLHCRKCGVYFTTEDLYLACPECHSLEMDVLAGLELSVESMDVADGVKDETLNSNF